MIVDYFLNVEILAITFHINLLAAGSIPVEGSSKNTIGGFPTMAIATLNFRLFPPLRSLEYTFSNFLSYNSSNNLSTIYFLCYNIMPLIQAYISKCSLHVIRSNKASN